MCKNDYNTNDYNTEQNRLIFSYSHKYEESFHELNNLHYRLGYSMRTQNKIFNFTRPMIE